MGKNNAKGVHDGAIELGGREFRKVKNGLDETQVVSFINELISQRDTLVQREEHLTSLTKLSEKVVTEADKLAEEIKTEAMNQTKAESAAIIAKAEEQAEQIVKEKRTEIMNIANEQAAAIKAEAEQKAELLLEEQRKRIQPELKEMAHGVYNQLLSELEGLKQKVAALDLQFEHELSQPIEETSPVIVKTDEMPGEFLEIVRPIDQISTGEPEEEEPEWELEILPPMDIMKIMGVVTYLDQLPAVEKTEIIPDTDRPSIIVFLREPIHLIDALRTLPEVAQVEEDVTGNAAGTNGKPKKAQIMLSGKTVPENELAKE